VLRDIFLLQLAISTSLARPRIINGEELDDISDYLYVVTLLIENKQFDQNNTVKSSSSGNNMKNIFKNPSSLDFKIRTFLINQSRVDIKLP
jgi:hypothetical protein